VKRAMTIRGNVIGEVERFKYLVSFVERNGSFVVDVKHRIKCGWMKWKKVLDILCAKRIPIRQKGKFYRSVTRPINVPINLMM